MLHLLVTKLSDSNFDENEMLKLAIDIKNRQKEEYLKNNKQYSRNYIIYKLFDSGIDAETIAKKYGIGVRRVNHIIKEQINKNSNGDPDIYEIDTMCRILNWRENERGKLQSILHKNGYTSFDDKWKNLSYDDILSIPNLGEESAWVIWLAQNMYV